jgi:hypothetical protein
MRERRLGLAAGFLDELPERASRLDRAEIDAVIREWFDPRAFQLVRVAPR